MTSKPCEWCGAPLHLAPAESWKTVHRECFKASKAAADRQLLREQRADALEFENTLLKNRVRDLEARADSLSLENMQLRIESMRLKRTSRPPPDPADFRAWIPKLIRLCHPDRHDNSRSANEVTQWLLSQRADADRSKA